MLLDSSPRIHPIHPSTHGSLVNLQWKTRKPLGIKNHTFVAVTNELRDTSIHTPKSFANQGQRNFYRHFSHSSILRLGEMTIRWPSARLSAAYGLHLKAGWRQSRSSICFWLRSASTASTSFFSFRLLSAIIQSRRGMAGGEEVDGVGRVGPLPE